VVAAGSELVTGGGRMFLESRRFDRSGERGRIGVVSLAAVADHHIGRRDNWMMAAANLRAIGAISAQAAGTMRRAATFGQLIGNSDMHFGNLSFFHSARGALSVTPVYDMLPMIYAPMAGDELPKRNFEPPLPVAGNLDLWAPISQRAAAYWEEVAAHEMISAEFARIARDNAGIAARAGKQVT
jgi:HipA-like C-terminal domain